MSDTNNWTSSEIQQQLYRALGSAIAELATTATAGNALSQEEQLTRGAQAICQIALHWNLEPAALLANGHERALELEDDSGHPATVWLVWREDVMSRAHADEVATGALAFHDARGYWQENQRAQSAGQQYFPTWVEAPDGTRFGLDREGQIQVVTPEEEPKPDA